MSDSKDIKKTGKSSAFDRLRTPQNFNRGMAGKGMTFQKAEKPRSLQAKTPALDLHKARQDDPNRKKPESSYQKPVLQGTPMPPSATGEVRRPLLYQYMGGPVIFEEDTPKGKKRP